MIDVAQGIGAPHDQQMMAAAAALAEHTIGSAGMRTRKLFLPRLYTAGDGYIGPICAISY